MTDQVQMRILDEARKMFFTYGYSKMTMDELALELGISKKTLYKYFSSKNDLIKAVIEGFMGEQIARLQQIMVKHQPTMEMLKEFLVFIGDLAVQIGQLPIMDIQRNAPELWTEINVIREREIMANFKDVISQAVEEGAVRNDIDPNLILLIFVSCINGIINPKTLSELPVTTKEAFESIIKVVFNGILIQES